MDIQVTHSFECSACGAHEDRRHTHRMGLEMLRPSLPDGWVEVDGKPYCPRHRVAVAVFIDRRRRYFYVASHGNTI